MELFPFDRDTAPRDPGHAPRLALAKTRLAMVAIVFLAGYLAISLRLVDLTLLRARPENIAEAELAPAPVPQAAPTLRAAIVDRNGQMIAASLTMASLYADTTLTLNAAHEAKELARLLPDQTEAEIYKKLTSGKRFVWIARNITPKQEYAINALGHPDLGFRMEDRRVYPQGELAAHVAGYTDVDGRGIAGIEKAFDAALEKGEAPVELTLDLRVQHLMRRELLKTMRKFSAKAAIGLVMDVNSGEIIAMVSLPDFDPHRPAGAPDDAKFNRATLGVFEMGSTMKLFSTAAALDAGTAHFGTVYDATAPIRYGRFTIDDYHAKRRALTLPEVFIHSSNIATAKMAEAMGPTGLKDFYKRMGFFEPAPVELPERGSPLYPKPWREINTYTASYGHGVAVSPLHLVRATAALVNGGTLVTPTILKNARDGLSPAPQGPRVVKPQTSLQVRRLLELTVAGGTGSQAYVEGYNVGGKTGTAEKNNHGRYDQNLLLSSFIGVFPVGNPRFAVLAMLDEPRGVPESQGYATGGWTAAPAVAAVIEQLGPLYRVPPDFDRGRGIVNEMAMYLKEMKEGKSLVSAGTDR